jgi:hypothetical protein
MAGRALPATLLFDHPTVASLTAYLAPLVIEEGAPEARQENTASPVHEDALEMMLGQIEGMSQEEVERRIRDSEPSSHV